MSLTQAFTPKCRLEDLVLPEEVVGAIRGLLEDQDYCEELAAEGLQVRRKVLLHGPSGCGKTSVAHALAAELKMPLLAVSLADSIESHLGESEKRVQKVFEAASQQRCVLLIDEFDSLGATRTSAASGSSLADNRIVNTILTCMEKMEPLGLLIACTNLFDDIDPAVRRRFDLRLQIPAVSREGLKKIAQRILRDRFGLRPEMVLAEASTPAHVVQVSQDLLRRAVIQKTKEERAQTLSLLKDDPGAPARAIREGLKKRASMPTGAVAQV